MARALELAVLGSGRVSPNPMVGCVLTRGTEVIGEGWHQGPGKAHAEVDALSKTGDANGATAYVTLEPCNHHGNTGPCAEALIEAGVAEVVYAVSDPNVIAAGGDATLQAAGIKTRSGVLKNEARELNRFWFHSLKSKRPYVISKSAISLDGRIATKDGDSQWITGDEARQQGHALRQSVDAVIVGAETIVRDDASLTARDCENAVLDEAVQPQRIVLDSHGRTSPGAKVYDRFGRQPILATLTSTPAFSLAKYKQMGVECLPLQSDGHNRPDVEALLHHLGQNDVQSVLIEGGGETIGSFMRASLVDEVWTFMAPHKIIGGDGRPAYGALGASTLNETLSLRDVTNTPCGGDILIKAKIQLKGQA